MSSHRQLPLANEPPPERADAARNRARIVAAARRLFAEGDPCSVTIDDVADAAGVGKGTVYRRFGDRAGLIEALLDERERAFQQRVLHGCPPLGPGAPPQERLQAFLCALADQLEEIGDLRAEVEAGQHWLDHPPHQFRRMHVRILIAEANPTLDAEALADALLAPLAAVTYHYQRRAVGYAPERIKEAVRTLTACLLAQ